MDYTNLFDNLDILNVNSKNFVSSWKSFLEEEKITYDTFIDLQIPKKKDVSIIKFYKSVYAIQHIVDTFFFKFGVDKLGSGTLGKDDLKIIRGKKIEALRQWDFDSIQITISITPDKSGGGPSLHINMKEI